LVHPLRLAHIAHGHDLDKGQIMAFARAPIHQREQLALVETLQRHGVDLDPQPRFLCCSNPVQHLRQTTPSGDVCELRIVQRIQRHVDPLHPTRRQISRIFAQLRAVGGNRQLLQTRAHLPAHRFKERHDPLTHQGFPARDAQLLHTHANKGRTQAL
jgi:hypothetical protein